MVLIIKGGGGYCSIGLMEVIWKAVLVILNRCFTSAITYHSFLQGFRAGRGTGTTTLEVKLLHHFAALNKAVLCAIFLDLHKDYDILNRYSNIAQRTALFKAATC